MDRQHLLPVVVGLFPHHVVPQDAGVVDEDVDPPGLLDDGGHDGFHISRRAHIGLQPPGAEFGRRFGQDLAVEVHHEDVRPRPLEMAGQLQTDAAGCARDDDRPAVEIKREVTHEQTHSDRRQPGGGSSLQAASSPASAIRGSVTRTRCRAGAAAAGPERHRRSR